MKIHGPLAIRETDHGPVAMNPSESRVSNQMGEMVPFPATSPKSGFNADQAVVTEESLRSNVWA